MSAEEALEKLKKLNDERDFEKGHAEADDILMAFLTTLGYADIVAAYDEVGKFYA